MPASPIVSVRPARQPVPKAASIAVPKGLAPRTRGQAGPIPKKLRVLRNRGTPSNRPKAPGVPTLAGGGPPGATDITPPSPIGGVGGGAPGSLPSFTAPPRPMNMPNMGLGHESNKRNPKGKGTVSTAAKPKPRGGVGAGMSLAQDRKLDRKAGIKEGSKRDNALDRKRGVSTTTKKK